MKQLVSILIPAYNAECFIRETLRSALAQTWPHKEIIVVDDGSTDDTLAAAREFESQRVCAIAQVNGGAAAARNRALAASQGEFIQYLDADDLLAPDKIERQMERLTASGFDNIAAGRWGRFTDDPARTRFRPEPVWQDLAPVDWLVCSFSSGGMMHPAAWLAPRARCEQAGPWDEAISLNDDGEYFCRVVLASKSVLFVDTAQTYYRSCISGSLSGRRSPEALESYYRSIDACTRHLQHAEGSSRTRGAAAALWQRFLYDVFPDGAHLIAAAEGKLRALGGSNYPPPGGKLFTPVRAIVGWKTARRLQRLWRKVIQHT